MKRPSEFLSIVIVTVNTIVGVLSAAIFLIGLIAQATGHEVMSGPTIALLPIAFIAITIAIHVIHLENAVDERDERIAELEAQLTPTAPAPQRADETEPQADH